MSDTIYRRFIEKDGLDAGIEAISYEKGMILLGGYYAITKQIEEALEKGTLRTPNAFYSFHKEYLEKL